MNEIYCWRELNNCWRENAPTHFFKCKNIVEIEFHDIGALSCVLHFSHFWPKICLIHFSPFPEMLNKLVYLFLIIKYWQGGGGMGGSSRFQKILFNLRKIPLPSANIPVVTLPSYLNWCAICSLNVGDFNWQYNSMLQILLWS